MTLQQLFDSFKIKFGREPDLQELVALSETAESEHRWNSSLATLKKMYAASSIGSLIYEDNPLLRVAPKSDSSFGGNYVEVPIKISK